MEGGLERLGLGPDLRRVLRLQRLASLLDRLLDARLGVGVDGVAQVGELALGLVGRVLGLVAGLRELALAAVLLGVRLGVLHHRLISSSERPEPALISIFCSLPVPRSFADTLRMPLASMSNATSICGMPRGAGGMPVSWNLPSDLLPMAISRSPCRTWISTLGWLSSAVENTSHLRVGMVVLRSMSLVITPPLVSMPRVSGVTSSSRTSLTSPASTPAWMAAPRATTSSGLTPRCGSLPVSSLTRSCTAGMRVMPPTRTTCSISVTPFSLASSSAWRTGFTTRSSRSPVSSVSLARVSRVSRCFGPRRVGRDERQVDLRLLRRGELDLGLLGRLVEALEGHLVLRQVDALGCLELLDEPVDDRLVEVVAAQVVVTGGGLDLEHAVADLEDRHVERAAAEVEDEDRLVGLLVEAVGERGRGRLVDDALDVEAGNVAGVLGRLALVVVEVRGDRDDRGVDGLAQVGLGVGLELLEDHRADLRRRVLLAARLHARVAVGAGDDLVGDDLLLLLDLRLLTAHEALDREDGVGRIGHRLALGHGAHEALAGLGERDDRGSRATTLGVLDHRRLAPFEDGHTRVGRPEVDSYGLAHA